MTTPEANQFITDVLRGLWQRWEPQDCQIREWSIRLLKFDYGRAEKAVKDLFFSTSVRKDPPAAKVMMALKENATIKVTTENAEPTLHFSIIKQRFKDEGKPTQFYATKFYATHEDMKTPPAWEEIQRRAVVHRESLNNFYREPHVILFPKRKKESSL